MTLEMNCCACWQPYEHSSRIRPFPPSNESRIWRPVYESRREPIDLNRWRHDNDLSTRPAKHAGDRVGRII